MIELIKYVKNSTYRINVLKAIDGNVKTPTEISKDSGVLRSHLSNVLRDLKEKELIECLNPAARKGRLYRLTDDGFEVLKNIK